MLFSELFSDSLKLFGKSEKALDLQLLIESTFGLSRTEFWEKKNSEIKNHEALKRYYKYRKRLLREEPIAYILKKKEFYGEEFFVSKDVLIPRPETEILIDAAINILKSPGNVLDIGAGCGNISIILAKHTRSFITAVEKSKQAHNVLKRNVSRHKLNDKISAVLADLFPSNAQAYDLIVSNPPYISEQEWKELPPMIRNYEPKGALVPGNNGLEMITRIIQGAREYLKPSGHILIEFGYNQKSSVHRLLKKAGFTNFGFIKDYSNIWRVASAQWES